MLFLCPQRQVSIIGSQHNAVEAEMHIFHEKFPVFTRKQQVDLQHNSAEKS